MPIASDGKALVLIGENDSVLRVMKSLTRRTKVPSVNRSSSGVYKGPSGVYKSSTKAITLTVIEGLQISI